jgi:hypothetical protein
MKPSRVINLMLVVAIVVAYMSEGHWGELRNFTPRPSPQPSPLSTGEREQDFTPA